MIPRYTRPAMGAIWNDEHKYRTWLAVEIAASEALAEAGLVPRAAARAIRQKGDFDLPRIYELEAEVKHDVIAFTTAVSEKIGKESRWLHFGLTSNDVVDTAQALLVREASRIILDDLIRLSAVLKSRALEFQHTPMAGRTHGMHAEPTTLGLKLANWYAENERNRVRFVAAAESMRVGKFSGAVGTFAHLDPGIEEDICERLGLQAAAISSQVIQRDRHAAYLATLAVIAGTLDKIATEVRHLQRTEVGEAEEYFSVRQKGSSAMPHKRNPVTSEQISGLARVVRANAQAGFENIPLWHERDISHSSVERIIFPDSTALADYLLDKTAALIEKLLVYPGRMQANLDSSGGLMFSGQLLLDLAAAGMSREDAYGKVQNYAMLASRGHGKFRDLVSADPNIRALIPPPQMDAVFDTRRQLRNVDKIFARVFGPPPRRPSRNPAGRRHTERLRPE